MWLILSVASEEVNWYVSLTEVLEFQLMVIILIEYFKAVSIVRII